MARPREFNEQAARDQALQVFWEKGYEATSLQDLLSAMGISKSSFYDTFTSKHALFLDSIDHYGATEARLAIDTLEGDAVPARDAIQKIFQFIIDKAFVDGDKRTCFVNNCAIEVGASDPEANERVQREFKRLRLAYKAAIARGIAAGDIRADHDPEALSYFFISSLNGLRSLTRVSDDRAAVERVVRVVMAALD